MRRGQLAPFFQKPCYSIQGEYGKSGKIKTPRYTITASEERLIANILAKSGYFGGNPEEVLKANGDIVIDTFYYEMFARDLEQATTELNKPKEMKK